MNETIWKFPLEFDKEQQILIPEGAKILSVMMQNGVLCIWAQVIPTQQLEEVTIVIKGTNHPIDKQMNYIGSVIDDEFVWHIYRL